MFCKIFQAESEKVCAALNNSMYVVTLVTVSIPLIDYFVSISK